MSKQSKTLFNTFYVSFWAASFYDVEWGESFKMSPSVVIILLPSVFVSLSNDDDENEALCV